MSYYLRNSISEDISPMNLRRFNLESESAVIDAAILDRGYLQLFLEIPNKDKPIGEYFLIRHDLAKKLIEELGVANVTDLIGREVDCFSLSDKVVAISPTRFDAPEFYKRVA